MSSKPLGHTKLLFAACALVSAVAAAADKKPPFVTRDDLASPWIGHSSNGATYRFALSLNGGGLIASVWPYMEAQFYRVTEWSIAGRVLRIQAVSEAYPEESLEITGKAWLSNLDLRLRARWRNGSAKSKLQMFPEAVTLKDYQLLKDGMAKTRMRSNP